MSERGEMEAGVGPTMASLIRAFRPSTYLRCADSYLSHQSPLTCSRTSGPCRNGWELSYLYAHGTCPCWLFHQLTGRILMSDASRGHY